MKEKIKLSQLAKKLNVTTRTIWNYIQAGKIKSYQNVVKGNHYFLWSEVMEDLGFKGKEDKITVGYCRVSTHEQKSDLERQAEAISQYCVAKGYQFKLITDIGSGINYKKKGLDKLLDLVLSNSIDRIVLTYKDRLMRFGSELFYKICDYQNIKIEIINQTEESLNKDKELVENMLEIITVFSSRLYGSRSHQSKKFIQINKNLLHEQVN